MNTPKFKVITNSTKKDNIPNIYKYNNVIHKKSKVINNIKARKHKELVEKDENKTGNH